MKKKILISGLIVAGMLLVGCSNNVVPNKKNIENYQNKKQKIKSDEKIIYIIKSYNLMGRSSTSYVECNNKRFRINSGEYIPCITKSNINTISYGRVEPGLFFTPLLESENTYASEYITIDYPKEKEMFYLVKPFVGKKVLKKIDKKLGESYIGNEDFKIAKSINNSTQGNSYSIALFNPSLIYTMTKQYLDSDVLLQNFNKKVHNTFQELKETRDSETQDVLTNNHKRVSDTDLKEKAQDIVINKMSENELLKLYFSKTLMKLDDRSNITDENEKDAKIIIYRGKDNGNSQVGLWTDDKYLGSLMVETYLEFRSSKNKLNLYSKYGKMQHLTINLEKGKTYYIEADSEIGWNDVYTSLTLKSKEDFNQDKAIKKITVDNNKINKNYQERINLALDIIKTQKWSQLTTKR